MFLQTLLSLSFSFLLFTGQTLRYSYLSQDLDIERGTVELVRAGNIGGQLTNVVRVRTSEGHYSVFYLHFGDVITEEFWMPGLEYAEPGLVEAKSNDAYKHILTPIFLPLMMGATP